MTIKSVNIPEMRKVALEAEEYGRVNIQILDTHYQSLGATVTPEDFAREITEANIPGLTVTYEKPFELPVVDGVYESATGHIYRRRNGSWFEYVGLNAYDHGSGRSIPTVAFPLVPMIPAKDADL